MIVSNNGEIYGHSAHRTSYTYAGDLQIAGYSRDSSSRRDLLWKSMKLRIEGEFLATGEYWEQGLS